MTPERFGKLKRALERRQPDLTVLADGVNKPHNVSAILRTCDAVGIHRLHAVSPEGPIRRHHMMAGGAKRWVEIKTHASVEDATTELRAHGWRLAAAHAEHGARDFRDVDYTERVAIVLGAELYGPSEQALAQADFSIRIPMHGLAESLNVSVAAAVILFEAERQRREAGLYDRSRLDPEEFERTLFEWAYPVIARRCRQRNVAYPPLSKDGALLGNPLARGV
ncbi:tRNA (guanosine(18)-2'-O)-methyltransferase TrmH [Candidatus Rariloculus sp.]|uniref:tRNA (guanosine(18)-2'-O)-methyltransferase TrmH n=1 Tax=Candidatus Rariloculus sp. TaxID=3101265 RepID=UPI003D09B172